MGSRAARLYEPVLGRLLAGTRARILALCPPRPGMRVADVGCGTGALLARYAAGGCRVAGVDASPVMLAEARRRLGRGALLAVGEATALPFAAGGADLVMATMLMHTLAGDARVVALAEMARVAGRQGLVLVADHRAGGAPGAGAVMARGLGAAVEGLAGHHAGVRSLRAAGGAAGLAPAAGLAVAAETVAAGGSIAVTLLRPAGTPAR